MRGKSWISSMASLSLSGTPAERAGAGSRPCRCMPSGCVSDRPSAAHRHAGRCAAQAIIGRVAGSLGARDLAVWRTAEGSG